MQNNRMLHGLFMAALFVRPAMHDAYDTLLVDTPKKGLEVVIDYAFAS
jgi:NADPH:quinone reductase